MRAYVADEWAGEEIAALRAAGCKVARGSLDDEGRLEAALEQVHTVVHLGGDLLAAPQTLLDDVASVVSAALGAGCRRLVWPSQLGAGEPGEVVLLRVCADAEQLLAETPLETVVLRRALTYGPGDPLTEALAAGPPRQATAARHAPLYVDDLVEAVVAADRQRGDRMVPHLVAELAGSDIVSVGELCALLGARRTAVVGRRGAARLPDHVVELLAAERLPGADAVVAPRSLADGIRRAAGQGAMNGDASAG